MFYYTHNGSDHSHELRIVTDNLGKFMDLLEICKSMGEDDNDEHESDEEYKAPWEEGEEEKKPKFRLEDYPNNYFMRCASPEESEIFYKVMCERFANKCITFNKDCTMFRWGKGDGFFLGEYGGSENGAYENHGFKELIFSDFDWSDYEN